MATERQILANRRNAQKSTGPRTEEGKAKSRRNALKHGLTGSGEVLPPRDQALFQERMMAWLAATKAQGQLEEYLVATAAVASVRMDRAARHEFAAIERRRKRAEDKWHRGQARGVARLAGQLGRADEPAAVILALEDCCPGCDWLASHWDALLEALEGPGDPPTWTGRWTADQAALALRLIGLPSHRPTAETDDDAETTLRLLVLAIVPDDELDPDAVDDALGLDTGTLALSDRLAELRRRLPEAGASRVAVAAWIDAEIDRLVARREQLWYDKDGPDLASAIDLAGVETDRRASLRLRYASASSSMFHRALNQLTTQRQERRRTAQAEEQGQAGPTTFRPADAPPRDPITNPFAPAPAPEPRQPNEPNFPAPSDDHHSTSVNPPPAPKSSFPPSPPPHPASPPPPPPSDRPSGHEPPP